MRPLALRADYTFPMPYWAAEKALEPTTAGHAARFEYWTERGRLWCSLISESLGPSYALMESEHFWVISSQERSTSTRICAWSEQVHSGLIKVLGDVIGPLYGKIPVIMVNELNTYYEYLAQYLPEGDHAFSSGVYLNQGYGHFLFCYHDMSQAEAVVAHELTHALLRNRPLPLWVNEGVAQLAEISITGKYQGDSDHIRDTIEQFWNPDTIQEFWSGESFNRQDEGQLQSYHLALVLTRKLTTDMDRFRSFLKEVSHVDGGEAAVQKHFGIGLHDLVEDYLGDGAWGIRSV